MAIASFLRIARALPEPMLLVTTDATVLAANAPLSRCLGSSATKLAGTSLFGLVQAPPEHLSEYLVACARSTQLLPGRFTVRSADGTTQPFSFGGALYEPRNGNQPAIVLLRLTQLSNEPTMFAQLNRQIFDLNREIAKRREVELELRRQQEWLRVTLSSIGDGVLATDTQGRVLFLNPAAERLTGWTDDEARDRAMHDVFRIINETTRETVENPVDRVLAEGRTVGLANHTLLLSRDGTEWPIADTAAPIRAANGEILGVVLVFLEISERREAEAKLRQQAANLIEADRRKDEFLAMLAHELRNPLGAVSNAIKLMTMTEAGSPEFVRAREIATRQLAHQVRMVDDLLDVSRITRGTFPLRTEIVDLRGLCRQTVEDCAAAFREAGIAIELLVPEREVPVGADSTRIVQLIANLLDNARKFVRGGGAVTLAVEIVADSVRLSVSDTGIGIAPELLPHLFEPFRQGEQTLARTSGGLGLGLALVRGIAELHGGTAVATSEGEGRGATFVVTLPLARAAVVQM